MEIIPNSTVILCHNVPLESNYENTIFWTKTQVDDGTQETYFKKFEVMRFNNQYYQRKDKGSLKLEVAMEKIFDCNYMMFRNSSFEKKWFYAFVDRIEYVNNVTCTIYYTIDIMQTYIGDYELNNCFVEREHSSTDNVGDNLVLEDLELGEYVSNSNITDTNLAKENYCIVVVLNQDYLITTSPHWQKLYGSLIGNVYQGVGFKKISMTADGLKVLNAIVYSGVDENAILGMYMFPSNMLPNNVVPIAVDGEIVNPVDNITTTINHNTTIDGYTPKNNKLFTSPFCFLRVSNLQGEDRNFEFEYFNNRNATFKLLTNFSANPSIILEPTNYRNQNYGKNDCLELSNFPQCSWTSNEFANWVYQGNLLKGFIGVGSSIASQGSKLIDFRQLPAGLHLKPTEKENLQSTYNPNKADGARNIIGVTSSILPQVTNKLVSAKNMIMHGNRTHDFGGSTSALYFDLQNFFYNTLTIRQEFARKIDGYFTMYGYATNQIKNPNRNARTNCTYVKTIGCTINGSVPAEDERAICDIHDNGIRYWNGTNVSNGTVQVAKYLDGNEYITNAVLPQ